MIKVELLNSNHLLSWKKLRIEALQNAPESFGSAYEEEITYSENDWESGLKKSDIFGAFVNDKLVGSAGFYTLNMLKQKHKGVLFGMYITPQHRGKGIANTLVETVILHAQSRVMQLHATCVTSNTSAIELYQKHGFKIYGTEPRALKIGNHFYDEHLMILNMNFDTLP